MGSSSKNGQKGMNSRSVKVVNWTICRFLRQNMSRYVPKLLNETKEECSPINRDRHMDRDMSATLGLIQPHISSEIWR